MTTAPQLPPPQADEMRDFMIVLRQALLMVVSWIERRYGLQRRV